MDDIVTTSTDLSPAGGADSGQPPVNRQGFEQDVKPAPFDDGIKFGSEDEAEARIAAALAGEAWTGDGAAPGDGGADGQTGGEKPGGDQQNADLKPIDAPAHWPADHAEAWANLPRSVQEAIAAPPQAGPIDLAAHPEVQTELAQFRTQRQQQHEAVSTLIDLMRAQWQGDELGKLTQADWDNMATTDPARYVQLQHTMNQRMGLMQQALHAQRQLAEQTQADQQQQQQEHLQQQRQLMEKHHPDFVGEKGKALRAEARDYLTSAGFTAEEVGQLADYRLIGVIKDAIRGRAAAKAADIAAKKVASAPPVARPTASAQSNPGLDKARAVNLMRSAASDEEKAALIARCL
jgi:hypothetical protein